MKKQLTILSALVLGGVVGASVNHVLEHSKEGGKSMNAPTHSQYELEKNVFLRGDTNSYTELSIAFMDDRPVEGLFWPLLMANKYDYAQGYYDVYVFLAETYSSFAGPDSALFAMDDRTRTLAIGYLESGAQRHGGSCQSELNSLMEKRYPKTWFGQNKIK